MMKIYNTLSREKEDFTPNDGSKNVKIYTCGLTVYSQPHIGNWVGYIYWDTLIRLLTYKGYDVNRVQNITDVGHLTSDADDGEDKMAKAAKANKMTAWDVANKFIDIADHEAYDLLKLHRPNSLVRATNYIDEQIEFVRVLEEKGFTYKIPGNGIYFDTSKLSDYGKLANLDIEGLREGARVETDGKHSPTDFAVWKFSPKDEKRDMEWRSPWGVGFPGWHLECSVMARELLGDQIDIHTGGIDHIPVHHTNEIAQTEAVTGKQFSKYWLHNNHIKVDGQKMSKSLGNIYTLNDIIERGYSLESFKLLVLSSSYHTEGNFTWEIMEAAYNRWCNFKAVADLIWQLPDNSSGSSEKLDSYKQAIVDKLSDDLDSPNAVATLDESLDFIKQGNDITSTQLKEYLNFADELLNLDLSDSTPLEEKFQKIFDDRSRAREQKNWELSDKLRDELLAAGIRLEDLASGQRWHRVKY